MTTSTRTAVVGLALLCLTQPAFAQQEQAPINRIRGTEQTIAGAERVVVGRVVSVEPVFFQNEFGDQLIISRTTVAVDETLKGPASPTVEVMIEGGSVGEITFRVSDIQPIDPGERGVFMLRQHRSGLFVPHQRGAGVLHVDPDGRIRDIGLTLGDVRSAAQRLSRQ